MRASHAASRRLRRGLFGLSASCFGLFLSYIVAQNLQTTLNGSLGFWSLGVIYLSGIFSCFAGPPIVRMLGPRRGLALGGATYTVFLLANFIKGKYLSPGSDTDRARMLSWIMMISTGILNGCGGSIFWTAQGTYMTAISNGYAIAESMAAATATSLFSAVFMGLFYTAQCVGNLSVPLAHHYHVSNSVLFIILTIVNGISVISCLFLPDPGGTDNMGEGGEQSETATGASSQPKEPGQTDTSSTRELWDVIRFFVGQRTMQLLAPSFMQSGCTLAFVSGVLTKAIKDCAGVQYIGYSMGAFTAVTALTAISFACVSNQLLSCFRSCKGNAAGSEEGAADQGAKQALLRTAGNADEVSGDRGTSSARSGSGSGNPTSGNASLVALRVGLALELVLVVLLAGYLRRPSILSHVNCYVVFLAALAIYGFADSLVETSQIAMLQFCYPAPHQSRVAFNNYKSIQSLGFAVLCFVAPHTSAWLIATMLAALTVVSIMALGKLEIRPPVS